MLFGILFFVYLTSIVASLMIAVREVQRPILALTWIVLTLLLPIISPSVYFMLSRRQIRRYSFNPAGAEANKQASAAELEHDSAKNLADWCTRIMERPPLDAKVTILKNGLAKYRVLLQALRSGRRTIDMEYYIFRDDEIGRAVTEILIDRSIYGLRVRLLIDGLGSRKLPQTVLQAMLLAGIQIRAVHPLSSWFSPMLTHRDHNKIVTIDGNTGFIGGMNVADEYTGRSKKAGFWRDTHLYLSGEAVNYLQEVFDAVWQIGTPLKRQLQLDTSSGQLADRAHRQPSFFKDKQPLVEAAEELAVPTEPLFGTEKSSDKQEISPSSKAWVQTVDSGPDSDAEHVRDLFFLCATEARNTLDIITPYFAPDTDIVIALKTAVARGVKVRLIVPLKPDHKIIGWAARTFYTDLLLAGINMFLYKKGVLHAKSIIVDKETCVVGAANYDLLSFRNNYESCEVIYGTTFAERLQDQFEADVEDSLVLTLDQMESEPTWAKIRNKGARLLAPLL